MPSPCDIHQVEKMEPTAVLEALLFLSGQPMKTTEIAAHTGWKPEKIQRTAQELETSLAAADHGLTVLRVAGGYQLVTKPRLFEAIQWVRTGTTELSPMALEVLAIVAFKQPITRAEIEKMRGVSSERILASLVQQGLVMDLGRKDSPGRPILYGTSAYFLECIGMDSLADLAAHIPAERTDVPQPAQLTLELESTKTDKGEADGKATESNE